MAEKVLTYDQHEEVSKILLHGELCSLLEAPKVSNQAVQEKVKLLNKDFQVDNFLCNAEELKLTICNINDINYGKIDLTNCNQQIMKLFEELLYIFSQTQKHSQTATEALISTFEYLLSGLPDTALISLDTVKILQIKVRTLMLDVTREIEKLCENINEVFDEVTNTTPDQSEVVQDVTSKLEELQGCLKTINFSIKEMSKSTQCFCLIISHEQLRSQIKTTKPKLKRAEIWQSRPFKIIVFNSYKIWIAFGEVSKRCHDSIMDVFVGMRKHAQEYYRTT